MMNSKVSQDKVTIRRPEMMTAKTINIIGMVVVVNAATIMTDDNRHHNEENVHPNQILPAPIAFIAEG
jgi:hypothetical protein